MGLSNFTTETQRHRRAFSLLGMVVVWLYLGSLAVGQDDEQSDKRYCLMSSYNPHPSVLISGYIENEDFHHLKQTKEEKIAEHLARMDRLKKFEEDQLEVVVNGVTYETLDDALEERLSKMESIGIPNKDDQSEKFWSSEEGLSETQKRTRQALIDRFDQMRIENGFSKIYMIDDTIRIITRNQLSKYKQAEQVALSDEDRLKKHEQRVREMIELRRKQEAKRNIRIDEYNAALEVTDGEDVNANDAATTSTLSREERLREHEARVRHIIQRAR